MSETSGLIDKPINASGSLSFVDVQHLGRFVIGTAGVVAKLAAPDAYLSTNRFKTVVANDATGWAFLFSQDGFTVGRDCIPIPPGQEVHLEAGYLADQVTRVWKTKADWLTEIWSTYTPAAVWSTATPAPLTNEDNVRYKIRSGLCAIHGEISGTDGNGCTDYTFGLPDGVVPYPLPGAASGLIPGEAWITVAGVKTNGLVYLDCSQTTGEDRLIKFAAPVTLTNAAAWSIEFNIWFEVDGSFSTYTPTVTETGGPATPTAIGRFKIIENMVYGYVLFTDADGAGTTAITTSLPTNMQDWNAKIPVSSLELVDTTYSEPCAYIDAVTNTVADRIIKNNAFSTWTDNVAIKYSVAFCYPLFGAQNYDLYTAMTFASAALTPASVDAADVSKFTVDLFDRVWWMGYWTSADGNACASLTILPPCPPKSGSGRIQLSAQKLVNATWSNPGMYLDADETDPDDRVANFHDLGTFTNAQAAALAFCGVYPI